MTALSTSVPLTVKTVSAEATLENVIAATIRLIAASCVPTYLEPNLNCLDTKRVNVCLDQFAERIINHPVALYAIYAVKCL
jgi:hypothetical protein